MLFCVVSPVVWSRKKTGNVCFFYSQAPAIRLRLLRLGIPKGKHKSSMILHLRQCQHTLGTYQKTLNHPVYEGHPSHCLVFWGIWVMFQLSVGIFVDFRLGRVWCVILLLGVGRCLFQNSRDSRCNLRKLRYLLSPSPQKKQKNTKNMVWIDSPFYGGS